MGHFDKYIIFNHFRDYTHILKNDIFDPTIDYSNSNDYFIAKSMIHSKKIVIFKRFISSEYILCPNLQHDFSKHYLEVYKIQNVLSRFVTMLKYKYSKPFNSKNMYYDNHKKNSICVFEFNRKFVFDIFEIQKIINNGVGILSDDVLIHSTIKNPYTNISFSYTALVNIFHHFKFNHYAIPKILHKLYILNFNYEVFYDVCKKELLLFSLQKQFRNLTNEQYSIYMESMIKEYGHDDYMNVSEDVLRNIFGRFVESFYVFCNYNVAKPYDGWIMVRHHRMKEYFTQFRKNNPSFGRKMLYKDITKSLTEVISTNYQIPDIL